MFKFLRLSLVALLLLAGMSAVVMAQTQATTGQIVGTVKDPQGAAVPGATVTITNVATSLSQNQTTSGEGTFRAVQLPPGDYTLTVNASGFGALTQTGYRVEVGSSLDANVTLQVSAVSEQVNVTAASVETTQSQSPVTINQTAVEELPINGRRFQDFATLTPKADIDPIRGQISLAGQRGINAQIQIDGADYTQPFFGGIRGGERSNQAFTIPQSSIREFQVVTSGYNAEFGRSTGGIINVVSKSGSNDLRGTLFALLRPNQLAHKNAFGQQASPRQSQFGGGVGGPIIKDKLFFFASGEQQFLSQARSVLFDNLTIFNPATAPGTQEAFDFYKSLETGYGQTNNASAFLGRVDYIFSSKNQFNVRYNYATNEARNAVTAGTSLQPTVNSALSNNGTEGDRQHTVVGQLTSFLNANTVNELRAQYSRERRPRLANAQTPLVSTSIGNFGTVSFLPTTEADYRVQVANNTTLNRGSHSFKVGGEFNRTSANQSFGFRQFGNFSLSDSTTNILRVLSLGSAGGATDPANRFDNSLVQYTRQIGNTLATLSSNEVAFFGQDSWRVRQNFTINYGLRYERQSFSQPDASNADLTNAVLNTPLPLGNPDPRVIHNQNNQFGPRLGFAYDPFKDSKTVIRGFGGIYYARTPLLTLAGPINNFRNPPGDVSLRILGFTTPCAGNIPASDPRCPSTTYKQFLTIGIDLNQFSLNNLPILTAAQVQQIAQNVAVARGQAINPFNGQQVVTAGNQLRNPRSYQFGFGVEREISKGFTVGADFDYVKTVHLNRNRDIDLPVPVIRANDLSRRAFFGINGNTAFGVVQNRPITQLGNGGFVQVREASAKSLYRAFTLRAQMRRKFGQFDAFYVRSKNLDDDTTERNATFAEYDNSYNLAPEYNFSDLDRKHQFVFNTVYNAPLDFQVSATGRFNSGRPLEVGVNSIIAPNGSGLTNAQYAALVTLSGNTTGDLNQDAGNTGADRPYVAPGVSSMRNSYRNRHNYNVDLRIQRNFGFGEKYRLTPSFEAFNVFKFKNLQYSGNTATNYGNPGINERTGEVLQPSNPNFLRLRDPNTGSYLLNNRPGAPLQIQLGVRLSF